MGSRDRQCRRRGRISAASALMVAVVMSGTACGPDPGPTAPAWVTTHVARTATPAAVTDYIGAWTSGDWVATLEHTTPTGGVSAATLLFFPRSGPANSVFGPPQALPLSITPSIVGPLGDSLVGIPGSQNSLGAVEFFRLSGSTWASAGVVTLPVDQPVAAINDHWLVTRVLPLTPGGEAHAYVYRLDVAGPTVTIGAPIPLDPDPLWPQAIRDGFGAAGVALDGDLLVVGAQGSAGPTPPAARVFGATGGSWSPITSLGPDVNAADGYGRAVAVDDGPTVDRVVLGSSRGTDPAIEVYVDSGSGFTLEQIITRDPGQPDVFGGALFGSDVAIDGDLLAVTSRGVTAASSDPSHADVKVGYVKLFSKGASWIPEAEVPVFTDPAPAATISSLPFRLKVSGSHVGVTMFVTPDPPVGCQFPCFNFGFEMWSLDRTG